MLNRRVRSFILASVLILSMAVSLVQPVLAATPTDVIGTVYKDAVTNLIDLGIISEAANYRPNDSVKRAELAKIAVVMLGLKNDADLKKEASVFSDVTEKHWALGFINVASEKGLIQGYNGKFTPDSYLTYEQTLAVLLRVLGYGPELDGKVKWPDGYLSKADEIGLIGDVKWTKSTDNATRGNVALLVWNALNCTYQPTGQTLLEEKYPDYAYAHRVPKTYEEIAKLKESTVVIKTYNSPDRKTAEEMGAGSGVVIGDGLIITNSHVVSYTPRYGVIYENSIKEYKTSSLFLNDEARDIAIIDSPNLKVKPVKLGNSDELSVGQEVVAIGSPLGLKNTVTKGIISAIRKEDGKKYIQFDAPIAFGSSGGALFNMYGELVGITSSGIPGENFNFAVPINDVKKLLEKGTDSYNVDLNIQLYKAMNKFTYEDSTFSFSNSSGYSDEAKEYRVDYYLYDLSEGTSKFIELYKTEGFHDALLKQLEAVNKLIQDKGYNKFVVNVAVADRNYTYRVSDGEVKLIKDTFDSMPEKISYEDYSTQLAESTPKCTIGGYSFTFNEAYVDEFYNNTNILPVYLYMDESNYKLFTAATNNNDENKKKFEEWMYSIGDTVSKQYPDKSVIVSISFFDELSYKPSSYSEEEYDIWQVGDTNKWRIFKNIMYVYDILGDEYLTNWY